MNQNLSNGIFSSAALLEPKIGPIKTRGNYNEGKRGFQIKNFEAITYTFSLTAGFIVEGCDEWKWKFDAVRPIQ